MPDPHRVAAIVPARNEEARVGATVRALRALAEIDEVIVVDDASSDRTSARASSSGASVMRLERRRGKGGALAAGLRRTRAEVVCFIDADLGAGASIASDLLRPVLGDRADMTIAAPPAGGPSGFGLVERLARWGIRRLCGLSMARPLSGQRALRRDLVEQVRLAPRFGVETALTIDAARAGHRVLEVRLPVEHRRTGRSPADFGHRARQGLDVACALAARAFRGRAPGR